MVVSVPLPKRIHYMSYHNCVFFLQAEMHQHVVSQHCTKYIISPDPTSCEEKGSGELGPFP